MSKHVGYDIEDFQRAAFRKERRSRRQVKTYGFIKRLDRRARRRDGKQIES